MDRRVHPWHLAPSFQGRGGGFCTPCNRLAPGLGVPRDDSDLPYLAKPVFRIAKTRPKHAKVGKPLHPRPHCSPSNNSRTHAVHERVLCPRLYWNGTLRIRNATSHACGFDGIVTSVFFDTGLQVSCLFVLHVVTQATETHSPTVFAAFTARPSSPCPASVTGT